MKLQLLAYLWRLLLGVWIGALLCFGAVVAPALFRSLPRAEAGAVVRQVIPVLDIYGLLAGMALLALTFAGPQAGAAWARRGLLLAMIALCAGSYFAVTPRLERLRQDAGGRISELPADHPARREFGRLHGVSTVLSGAVLLLGLVALATRSPGGGPPTGGTRPTSS
jgi:hypothetical protein